MSPHSIISMKFSSDYNHLFHEECGSSIMNVEQRLFVEMTLPYLEFFDITICHQSAHIYRWLPNMCSANKQEMCSVASLTNADPNKVPHVESGMRRLLVALQ
jgi:hypothetical protein